MTNHYHEHLRVMDRVRHPSGEGDNPYCKKCGWRTYPQWIEAHVCSTFPNAEQEVVVRMRHVAGDVLSNLHFYRIAPDIQAYALTEALGYMIGANLDPHVVTAMTDAITRRLHTVVAQQTGRPATGVVAAVATRLKVKKKKKGTTHGRTKNHRPHRQTIPARRQKR